jgi:hypothetical protein
MSDIPITDNERRERAEEWERYDRRKAQERFYDLPLAPPIPKDHKLIPSPYGVGSIIIPTQIK